MCYSTDFKNLSIQYSVFTPGLQFSSAKILGNLSAKFSSVFDGDPVSLPMPADAPVEIPRIILKSSDNKTKFEAALNRMNFFTYLKKNETDIDEKVFRELFMNLFKEYIKITSAKIGRLALVRVKFVRDDNPGLTLAKHFCKDKFLKEPFNRPENFELHSHKKYILEGFTINSWVRCKSGFLKTDNTKLITVQQDINTLAEELDQKDFREEDIVNFFKIIPEEHQSILYKYFPDNE
jgi:hypothetical protein